MNRAWNVIATVVVLSVLGCASGCAGTSVGYQNGVKFVYPEVADRLSHYSTSDPSAAPAARQLRDAAADPVTYDKASAAWQVAAPVYRRDVSTDVALVAHRKQDWLATADLIDRLQSQELKRRNWWFQPAATQPSR